MHCTGHTSTHARSLVSIHASVMIAIPDTVATPCALPSTNRPEQLLVKIELDTAVEETAAGEHDLEQVAIVPPQPRPRIIEDEQGFDVAARREHPGPGLVIEQQSRA